MADNWDGQSLAEILRHGAGAGRDYLVVSQCAWSCQRAVRFGSWMLIRTYHDGFKGYPPVMLFNVETDPHELTDLVDRGLALLEQWHSEMMAGSQRDVDPLWTVMREGGPFHTRGQLETYCRRLRDTGRAQHAETLLAKHSRGEWAGSKQP